jgi:hypothetical protein
MGFIEEKERLAGLDAESSIGRASVDFEAFWRALAEGHGGTELERALATARSIAEGDYDAKTRHHARRLAVAAREKFAQRAEDYLNRKDVSVQAAAHLHKLAEMFASDGTIVDDRILALETRLRIAVIKSQFARLSDADQRAVLRELRRTKSGARPRARGRQAPA